jgi:hypothetical protein
LPAEVSGELGTLVVALLWMLPFPDLGRPERLEG